MNEFIYNLSDMEGMIGGSDLDLLRHDMVLGSLSDGDIVFKLVEDSSIDLTQDLFLEDYGIKGGFTFVARCIVKKLPDYKYVFDSELSEINNCNYYKWIPIPEIDSLK